MLQQEQQLSCACCLLVLMSPGVADGTGKESHTHTCKARPLAVRLTPSHALL